MFFSFRFPIVTEHWLNSAQPPKYYGPITPLYNTISTSIHFHILQQQQRSFGPGEYRLNRLWSSLNYYNPTKIYFAYLYSSLSSSWRHLYQTSILRHASYSTFHPFDARVDPTRSLRLAIRLPLLSSFEYMNTYGHSTPTTLSSNWKNIKTWILSGEKKFSNFVDL